MPNHIRRLALPALLCAISLTGCAGHPVLSPRQNLPADWLVCKPQPAPGEIVSDAGVANFILDLADAGAECREHLSAVKQALGQ